MFLGAITFGLLITGVLSIFKGEFKTGIFCLVGSFIVGTIGGLIFTPKR